MLGCYFEYTVVFLWSCIMISCLAFCFDFRYNRYERDKVVSFVPPDGHFELMRYRPNGSGRPIVPPLFCQVCIILCNMYC